MANQPSIDGICEQVYRRFPEVAGVKPRIKNQPGDQLLLTFQGSAKTVDGRSIQRIVRVVVNASGKIIKMTTSR